MEDKLELSCLANMSMIQVHVLYLPLKKKKLERKLNENLNVDPIVFYIWKIWKISWIFNV